MKILLKKPQIVIRTSTQQFKESSWEQKTSLTHFTCITLICKIQNKEIAATNYQYIHVCLNERNFPGEFLGSYRYKLTLSN